MIYVTHINTNLYKAIENEGNNWIEHMFFKISVLSSNIISAFSVTIA